MLYRLIILSRTSRYHKNTRSFSILILSSNCGEMKKKNSTFLEFTLFGFVSIMLRRVQDEITNQICVVIISMSQCVDVHVGVKIRSGVRLVNIINYNILYTNKPADHQLLNTGICRVTNVCNTFVTYNLYAVT